MIVYPLYDEMQYYRVSEDPDFDPSKPIKEAFLRTYANPKSSGNASIVCGHHTTIHQEGKHYTWLREPLKRDVSHFNYDCNYGHELSNDFATHLSMMEGNFLVLWLYEKYCQLSDTADIEKKYHVVKETLKNKFTKVYDSDNFEYSWTKIADELHVDSEPRLNSNEGGRAYQRLTNSANMSEEFKTWHRTYNHYDYLLYEEFCV
tara:strand:+ start:388 stop:999 length:612 start_codon:yes stop_codon:yes gene_type:complete